MPNVLPDEVRIPEYHLARWAAARAGKRSWVYSARIADGRADLVAADEVFRIAASEGVAGSSPGPSREVVRAIRDVFDSPLNSLLEGLETDTREPGALKRLALAPALAFLGGSPRAALHDPGRFDSALASFDGAYGAATRFEPLTFLPPLGRLRLAGPGSPGGQALIMLGAVASPTLFARTEDIARGHQVGFVRCGAPGLGFATGDAPWVEATWDSLRHVVFPLSWRACMVFSKRGPIEVAPRDERAFCEAVNAAVLAGSRERIVFLPDAPGLERFAADAGGWNPADRWGRHQGDFGAAPRAA